MATNRTIHEQKACPHCYKSVEVEFNMADEIPVLKEAVYSGHCPECGRAVWSLHKYWPAGGTYARWYDTNPMCIDGIG